jgi:chemotaxis protein histidine kinase CheA
MSDLPGNRPDPVIMDLFRSELDTHLPTLSQGLLAMEKGQVDASRIEAMMRAAHSIKGAARIVGIGPVVSVAHAMEDCFSAAKSRQIVLNSQDVDVLLEGVDALQQLCSPGAAACEAGPVEELIKRMAAVRDGRRPPRQSVEEVDSAADVAQPSELPPRPARLSILLPAVVDESTARSLRSEWVTHLDRAPSTVQLDFSQVTRLTSVGLAFLASFIREAAQAISPVAVTLHGVRSELHSLWRVLGLQDLLAEH